MHITKPFTSYIYSRPPNGNTADLGADEKAVVFGKLRWKESYYITKKNTILDSKMVGGIGGGGGRWTEGGSGEGAGGLYTVTLYWLYLQSSVI